MNVLIKLLQPGTYCLLQCLVLLSEALAAVVGPKASSHQKLEDSAYIWQSVTIVGRNMLWISNKIYDDMHKGHISLHQGGYE